MIILWYQISYMRPRRPFLDTVGFRIILGDIKYVTFISLLGGLVIVLPRYMKIMWFSTTSFSSSFHVLHILKIRSREYVKRTIKRWLLFIKNSNRFPVKSFLCQFFICLIHIYNMLNNFELQFRLVENITPPWNVFMPIRKCLLDVLRIPPVLKPISYPIWFFAIKCPNRLELHFFSQFFLDIIYSDF